MPCMDHYSNDRGYGRGYDDGQKELKARCDMLARIACIFATALEAELEVEITRLDATKIMKGSLTEEAVSWWVRHKIDDAKHEKEKKIALAKYEEAMAEWRNAMKIYRSLSPAQIQLLKVTKPSKPKLAKKFQEQ